jgi:ABC-2 type transport system ATP-binding protein
LKHIVNKCKPFLTKPLVKISWKAEMETYAIRTNQLTCNFETVCAVDHLNLQVPTGIVFGFLGPNGSGKTTTIRLLLGLLEPTQGAAEVLGLNLRTQAQEIRQRSGALLEYNGIYERLSAQDNLEFYGQVWRIAAGERRSRIKELLQHLDLWERRNELASTWSRGMKQKLAIARALLHRPQLIFLDEPTAGLDPVAAAALRGDLATLADREGITVFLTTHNLAEAEKLCQLVGVVHNGRLLALGSPEQLRNHAGKPHLEVRGSGFTPAVLQELRTRPEVSELVQRDGGLFISLNQSAETAPLVSLLVRSGVQIDEVRKGQADLEDTFLSLVEEARLTENPEPIAMQGESSNLAWR